MARRLLLASALLLVGLACSADPTTNTGYVRDKEFVPAHWEDGYRYEPYQDCGLHLNYDGDLEYDCETKTRSIYEEHHTFYPDAWRFFLEECTGATEGKGHTCIKNWLNVDETTYHQYNIGTHYPDRR